jgi:hypothetical protein
MLKAIVAIIGLVALILRRVFARRQPPKPASEHLKDPSPTAEAVEEGEAKATKKFGPRP